MCLNQLDGFLVSVLLTGTEALQLLPVTGVSQGGPEGGLVRGLEGKREKNRRKEGRKRKREREREGRAEEGVNSNSIASSPILAFILQVVNKGVWPGNEGLVM